MTMNLLLLHHPAREARAATRERLGALTSPPTSEPSPPRRRRWLFCALFAAAVGSGPVANAEGESERPASASPYLLGRLLGGRSHASVRGGLWLGYLTDGLFSAMDRGGASVLLPELADIGRGSGLVTELGVGVTLGDYDFAFSFLTDQLLGSPAGDDAAGRVVSAVLKQLVGELRTRALESLVGTELSLELRTGNFTGPVDGTKFKFRDNEPWFAGRDAAWGTDYLSISLGALLPADALLSVGDGTFVGLRYTSFGKPQAADPFTTFEVSLVETRVRGLSAFWKASGQGQYFQAYTLLGLGAAQLDYGAYGQVFGFLGEIEFAARLHYGFSLGDVLGLLVYAGFRANLVQPITHTFSGDADRPIYINGIVDYLLWGPITGLEVTL
jgi:hypothetical protein